MDLIRLRARPQTPVPPRLPASPAPEPEGTGTPGLGGELGENAAALFFGDGGSACHHPHRAGGTPLLLWTCLGVGPAPHGGNGCWEGARAGPWRGTRVWTSWESGEGEGKENCRSEDETEDEKDRESGKDAFLYPS